MKIAAVLLAAAVTLIPNSAPAVSVAYAASLVAVMEGPIARDFESHTEVRFAGEAKGSRALANLIRAGLRSPDVFISADPALFKGLVRSYVAFGSARMVVAYSPKSAHAQLFAAATRGTVSVLDALSAGGVRVGRTDPAIDPKGARTVRVIGLLGRHFHRPDLARNLLAAAHEFPEEDLAVRVQTGELDAGFFYSTESAPMGLPTIELPAGTNLANQIAFGIAVLPHAAHPRSAQSFLSFILYGRGKRILESAGLHYFKPLRVVSEN
ncbi:MAG TPA: substrate-binding domain-containing protein [Candidatus Rubrimentiphilum sp.]|nr:substrate-binding domain-containing protein [Candidatus Rubrimentiphilum sp.]